MTEESYSSASEAVDQAIQKSIETLTSETRAGFDRVERHIGEMVTKGEFRAEVARLDMRDDTLDRKVDSSFADLQRRNDRQTKKTQWAFSWVIAAAGVASGAIFGTLQLLG